MTVTLSGFEQLVVNNPELAEIEAHLNQFNPLKVMKVERMEIRHSAILGWLLDPAENHGLGDKFLRAFLAESLRGEQRQVTAIELSNANLNDARVHIEWNNIDIMVDCPSQGWAFIIENKVDASQSANQLKKYRQFAEGYFKAPYQIIGVFLTLHDEAPQDDYCAIKYHQVCELIGQLMAQHRDLLSAKVYGFIESYQDTISRICGMNDEENQMKVLAKKIYQQHRHAIDFIVEHGSSTQFEYASEQVVGQLKRNHLFASGESQLRLLDTNKAWFSLLPDRWCHTLGLLNHDDRGRAQLPADYRWQGCERWWSGYPLICWLELRSNNDRHDLRLVLELGPLSHHPTRLAIIDQLEQLNHPNIGFQTSARREGTKYSRFLKNSTQFVKKVNDPHNAEELSEKMSVLIAQFEQRVLNDIDNALSAVMAELNQPID